jgi:hypothetical protein
MRSVLFLTGICFLCLLFALLIFPPRDMQTVHLLLGFIGSAFVIATLIVPRTR